MSQALAKKLAERHPKLFAKANLGRSDVQPGWFNIIDRLCSDIEGVGSDVGIGQISEKFADLHVYLVGADRDGPPVRELVKAAKTQCMITCQWCSKPAEQRLERGWCRTLCEGCEERAKSGWRGTAR